MEISQKREQKNPRDGKSRRKEQYGVSLGVPASCRYEIRKEEGNEEWSCHSHEQKARGTSPPLDKRQATEQTPRPCTVLGNLREQT